MPPVTKPKEFAKWLVDFGFEPLFVLTPLLVVMLYVVNASDPRASDAVFEVLILLMPFFLLITLARIAFITWVRYLRFQFWRSQEHMLLKVEPPREVPKSPLAMELFLSGIWNTSGETTFLNRQWDGKFRPITSLEIASDNGQLHFYIHIRRMWHKVVEARLYGQFPEARITEVEDYTLMVPFDPETWGLHGVEYKLAKTPQYPIRTYIDYKLDKDPDEELKVDPITNLLEMLGHVSKDEHFWMQIIFRARKKDDWYGHYSAADSFKKGGEAEIHKILEKAAERSRKLGGGDEAFMAQAASRGTSILTDAEKRAVEAIERKLARPIFEAGIRVLYLAPKKFFNNPTRSWVNRFFETLRSQEFNAITATRGLSGFDYFWQDFKQLRRNAERRRLFKHYRNRSYLFMPYDQDPLYLTAEELATLWHFPGSVVQTPTMPRVMSKSSDAPPNLPI